MDYYLLAIVIFILLYIFFFKSKFTSKASKKVTPDVMIFYAPWCGHCKKSMDEFTKASVNKDTDIVLINTTLPESRNIVEQYGVTGFPTIIKNDGTKYTGPRMADDIINFAKKNNDNTNSTTFDSVFDNSE